MNKLAVAIVGLSIAIGTTPFLADEILLEEQARLDSKMSALVYQQESNDTVRYGANPDGNFSTMSFGEMPSGTPVIRRYNFTINGNERLATLKVEGNISEKLEYDSKNTISGEGSIPVRFESNETGYFSGDATLVVQGATNQAGELWIDLKTFY